MRRVLVPALLLALTACSSATPSPSSSAASPGTGGAVRTAGCSASPAASPAASSADPVDVAGRIGQRGEADFAAVFAGARVGDDGVEVYRKPSKDLDAWLLAEFRDACVIVRDARFSAAELAQRYQQVNDDTAYWSGQGVQVNSVSSDFVRGVVVVGTQEVEKAKPLFAARYASGVPVELVAEAPA